MPSICPQAARICTLFAAFLPLQNQTSLPTELLPLTLVKTISPTSTPNPHKYISPKPASPLNSPLQSSNTPTTPQSVLTALQPLNPFDNASTISSTSHKAHHPPLLQPSCSLKQSQQTTTIPPTTLSSTPPPAHMTPHPSTPYHLHQSPPKPPFRIPP